MGRRRMETSHAKYVTEQERVKQHRQASKQATKQTQTPKSTYSMDACFAHCVSFVIVLPYVMSIISHGESNLIMNGCAVGGGKKGPNRLGTRFVFDMVRWTGSISIDQSSSSHPPPPIPAPSSNTSTVVPKASFPCRIMSKMCALNASTRASVSLSAASFLWASSFASSVSRGLAWMSLTSIMPAVVIRRAVGIAADALVWWR